MTSRRLVIARRRVFYAAIACLTAGTLEAGSVGYAVPASETIHDESPGSSRTLDIVVLAEGYTEADLPVFKSDARAFADALFMTKPFGQNRRCIRIHIVNSISRERGADRPRDGVWVDTAFGASYWIGGNDSSQRFLTCYDPIAVARAAKMAPGADAIAILVQSPKHGGGGNRYAVTATHANFAQTLVHELGHSLGGLWDEYPFDTPAQSLLDFGRAPNLTGSTSLADLKWRHLVRPGTQAPGTRPEDGIGMFPVGNAMRPIYRPADSCLMEISGSRPCDVCSERLATRIAEHADLGPPPAPTQFWRTQTQSGELYVQWEAVSTIQPVDAYYVRIQNGRTAAWRDLTTTDPWIRLDPGLAARGDRLLVYIWAHGQSGWGTWMGCSFAMGEPTLPRVYLYTDDGVLRPTISLLGQGEGARDWRIETVTGKKIYEVKSRASSLFRCPTTLEPGEQYAFWFRDLSRQDADWVGVLYSTP